MVVVVGDCTSLVFPYSVWCNLFRTRGTISHGDVDIGNNETWMSQDTRSLVLFKNGVEVGRFIHQGPMHKYVNDERQKDHYAKFWALEDGKLTYDYQTQKAIDVFRIVKEKVAELEEAVKNHDCDTV